MGKYCSDLTDEEEAEFFNSLRRRKFIMVNQNIGSWMYVARRHKRAADLLYEVAYRAAEQDFQEISAGTYPVGPIVGERYERMLDTGLLWEYYLLAGYALENCFKGLLLAREPHRVESGKLDSFIMGHDLGALADKCVLPLSPEEREILKLITRNVLTDKYPAPLDASKVPDVDPNDTTPGLLTPSFNNRGAQVRVNGVYDRAMALMQATRDQVPPE